MATSDKLPYRLKRNFYELIGLADTLAALSAGNAKLGPTLRRMEKLAAVLAKAKEVA